MLKNIPEHMRGWFYLAMAVIFLLMFVAMFVVALLNGEDLTDWWPVLLAALGLAPSTLAASNTRKTKQ